MDSILNVTPQFVKRELGCKAYLRYVDDFALFANNKQELWQWKVALISRLAQLRLTIHDQKTQVLPTANGVPWLGFVVYPDFRKVKARKVRHASRRLEERYAAYCDGHISFAEFDASVQGWINHVRFADTWGLRRHVLGPFRIKPGDLRLKNRTPLRGAISDQPPSVSVFSAPATGYSMGDKHNTRKPTLLSRSNGKAA